MWDGFCMWHALLISVPWWREGMNDWIGTGVFLLLYRFMENEHCENAVCLVSSSYYFPGIRRIAFSQCSFSINHIKKQNHTLKITFLRRIHTGTYRKICSKNPSTDRQEIVHFWHFLVPLGLECARHNCIVTVVVIHKKAKSCYIEIYQGLRENWPKNLLAERKIVHFWLFWSP